ncbi:protoporphyrinogen oxidase [Blastopirellula marina]|uniref:Coproporphyrinogen III oxidase n=1 Tax=Blastopirellula marina TaxID=124 RepID=A0A2S8GCA7_9BACT|nr:protoporphyrinogen oxidase [Blastopirellula marina]PQO42069.1 protoporphyrinogen oxidase [Blastopirellula marina]
MTTPSVTPRRVAVIGGGISGLAAAFRLTELDPNCQIELFEADDQLGGVLQTVHTDDGYLLEQSADNFITNIPFGLDLCKRLGIEGELVTTNEALRKAFVLREGNLYPVPEGFVLMAPSQAWSVVTTPILSWAGKLRLAQEYFIRKRESLADESLESFVTRRMGQEVYERLVQPLIGGIYTADPKKLSIQATLKQFVQMEQEHGSVIRGMRKRTQSSGEKNDSGARYSMFVAPKQGMAYLIDTLRERLAGHTIRLSTPVTSLHQEDQGWTVQWDGGQQTYDAAVVAVPAPQAAKVLSEQPTLTQQLSQISYAGCSVAIVCVDRSQIGKPVEGFGFVVPEIENRKILAVSFTSFKYPNRAPEGKVMMRVFVGGACHPELDDLSDDELKKVVNEELAELIGLTGEAEKFLIRRWNGKMPQYHLGHLDRVAALEAAAAQLPGLELAGNAYRGVGVPQCIQSGEQAAARVVEYLSQSADRYSETT